MPDLPTSPRRYDEKEVSHLFERASELQRALPSAQNPTGLTLAEIQEIAAEAGLDAGLIRQAASELEVGGTSGWGAKLLAAPLNVSLEQTLPFEVPGPALAELALLIQTGADLPGNASLVGRSLIWHSAVHNNHTQTLQAMVSTGSGETRIRIEERYHNFAGAIFGGIGGGGGLGVGLGAGLPVGMVLGSAAATFLLPAGIIAATFGLCRKIYSSTVRKRRRILDDLMTRIVESLNLAAEEAEATLRSLPPSDKER